MRTRVEPRSPGATESPLRLWWWGEDEAVGISRWVADTIARFEADTGVSVDSTYLATDEVVPRFTAAAAAGEPPDIQYLWNGIYHMENVWRGYLAPLNGMVFRKVLERSGATRLSIYEDQQYRTGFYAEGFGVAYNKDLFDRAGLNPDAPPHTWDQFLFSCERLKAANLIPF